MLPKIAVIGNGYWGKNLVRNFHALGVLKYVCDSRSEAQQEAHDQFGVDTCSSLKELINDPEIQGAAETQGIVDRHRGATGGQRPGGGHPGARPAADPG